MATTEHESPSEVLEPERAREVLPAVIAHEAMVTRSEVGVTDIVQQRDKIKEVMEAVMVEGVHYGKVPGVSKPTLLKPGAEVLNVTFRLAPSYHSERMFEEYQGISTGHLTVVSRCVLTHAPSGMVLGEGEGLCTTREKKYAYRSEGRVCPVCEQPTIKKSKYPPRENDYPGADRNDPPGWYCHAKVGGCGANFKHDDPRIAEQETGRVANPDLPDTWNTVLKMGDKRALVAAVLNVTAASDIFTQDVEDSPAAAASEEVTHEERKPSVVLARSWAEWTQRMAELGVTADDSAEWMRQATEEHDLSTDEAKTTLFQKANRVMVALAELADGGLEFHADPRPVIQRAFAGAFDGKVFDGPEWRIGPGEDDRLTKDEIMAAAASSDPGTSDVDDIPF